MAKENDEAQRELARLVGHVEHIIQIVNTQQSIARSHSIQEPVDVVMLVENAVKITDSALMRHHVTLKRQFDEVPQIITDKHKVTQILINLIKNAREAGSAPAEIELRVETQPDGSSDIDVLDRGPGFSAEAMQHSLVPLYTTKPQGSGMGLALSREIVEAHRGSLDVSNRPDGGACVRVHLAGRAPALTDASRSRLTLTRG